MSFIAPPRPGRHLMVLGDAESIAHQARRRAAVRRRRMEALKAAAVVIGLVSIVAVVLGAAVENVVLVVGVLFGAGAAVYRRLLDHVESMARRRVRAAVGPGIGTPRPKGGFSTTRHRSGEPVWVDRRVA